MKLRLLAAAGLLALLAGQPAFAQDECADMGLSAEECAGQYGGTAEPAYEEPAYEEPAYEEPAYEEPAYEEPAYEEPAYEEPAYEEPAYEEPAVEEPAYEEPAYEEPAVEEPVYDEPAYEEPAVEEPAYEEPAVEDEQVYEDEVPADEPALDEQTVEDKPAIDEQVTEDEPVVEDETVIEDEPVVEEETAVEDEQVTEDTVIDDVTTQDDEPVVDEETTDEPVAEDDASTDEQVTGDDDSFNATALEDDAGGLIDESVSDEVTPDDEAFAEPETVQDDPFAEAEPEELSEAVEPLGEGTDPEERTAIFDSGKTGDFDETADTGEDTIVPETDEQASVLIETSQEDLVSQFKVEGTTLEAAPTFEAPQDVTIIENNTYENTTIYQVNNTYIVNNYQEDRDRLSYYGSGGNEIDYVYDQIGDNRFRETLYRDNGSVLVTTRDRYGNILERYVVNADGSSYVLAYFDPSYQEEIDWVDVGFGLPPLRLNIPLRDYVLDWRYADANAIETFFRKPPVEQARRVYSIDEVKRSARLRDSVRRLEVNNLNFASGSAELSRNQARGLERLATAITALLKSNPGETFLIEGHTDAKGSAQANLVLSDKRASNVARILSQFYGIPPENLTTQGYGEQFLKVNTQRAEPQNRRVTVRRITPLISPRFAG